MDDNGHWTLIHDRPDDATGFVYLIINRSKGKYYVGQKSMYSKVTRPPLKGKTRKRKITKDSNWRDYKSSSKDLQQDIKDGDNVDYHVVYWSSSKSELNYIETKLQYDLDAVVSDTYYNGMINIRQSKTVFGINWQDRYRACVDYVRGKL